MEIDLKLEKSEYYLIMDELLSIQKKLGQFKHICLDDDTLQISSNCVLLDF